MHACSKQLPPLSAAGLQDRGAPAPPLSIRGTHFCEGAEEVAGGRGLSMHERARRRFERCGGRGRGAGGGR